MFYAMHDRAGEGGTATVDVFLFFLAEKLGKSLTELDDLPASELMQWRSYWTVKNGMDAVTTRALR